MDIVGKGAMADRRYGVWRLMRLPSALKKFDDAMAGFAASLLC